ncbi:hypothetical protein BaRGS_00037135 [Batillaria attramentaria]|uniref:Uncharacterized protein n=1 Tax=Batillaria attramentaria TaxID=370345 RepID=A0ABD0J9S6_9CAEN
MSRRFADSLAPEERRDVLMSETKHNHYRRRSRARHALSTVVIMEKTLLWAPERPANVPRLTAALDYSVFACSFYPSIPSLIAHHRTGSTQRVLINGATPNVDLTTTWTQDQFSVFSTHPFPLACLGENLTWFSKPGLSILFRNLLLYSKIILVDIFRLKLPPAFIECNASESCFTVNQSSCFSKRWAETEFMSFPISQCRERPRDLHSDSASSTVVDQS